MSRVLRDVKIEKKRKVDERKENKSEEGVSDECVGEAAECNDIDEVEDVDEDCEEEEEGENDDDCDEGEEKEDSEEEIDNEKVDTALDKVEERKLERDEIAMLRMAQDRHDPHVLRYLFESMLERLKQPKQKKTGRYGLRSSL